MQDNLNTHHGGSFDKFMTPEAAHRLVGRFEWVFTPRHASWLNMAELEFSALSRQCLNRSSAPGCRTCSARGTNSPSSARPIR
ncbi:transposase [Deinococcus sp. QL22]|uniref:transposase n=1 Tax=Deinococcus sp. QL22 TaxID=2939437 RepID=UPI0035303A67